jgi:hypothetical protein
MSKSPPVTPLLTDEELDALIQAFNRRESTPGLSVSARASLVVLTLSLIGLAGWWWS